MANDPFYRARLTCPDLPLMRRLDECSTESIFPGLRRDHFHLLLYGYTSTDWPHLPALHLDILLQIA